ncbi:hypothetical protein GCM10010415_49420 [Streptomyces atrovirens]|uniref:DUF397 domain-containing protein n=1 Tax=Streptomyces atrovirens TaxID=285556 RepID=A0ABW0E2S1_9ACTN
MFRAPDESGALSDAPGGCTGHEGPRSGRPGRGSRPTARTRGTVGRPPRLTVAHQAVPQEERVAAGLPAVVPVRDSKSPHGPVLRFPATARTAFPGTLKGPGPA